MPVRCTVLVIALLPPRLMVPRPETILIGSPEWILTNPLTSHPPATALNAPRRSIQRRPSPTGISHTQRAFRVCVMSYQGRITSSSGCALSKSPRKFVPVPAKSVVT